MAELIIVAASLKAASEIQQGRETAAAGRSQLRIANYNATLMERKAQAIEQKTTFDQWRHAIEARERLGEARLWGAGTGADPHEGAPVKVEEEQAAEDELKNLLIGYEGRVQAGRARSQAELDRLSGRLAKKRGKAARRASYFRAGGTLLTGFGMSGTYPKAPASKGFQWSSPH